MRKNRRSLKLPHPSGTTLRQFRDLLDSALKNTFITVGTIWFVATVVAVGAFALQLQLITTIAAFVVATMMCAWLAGLSFMVVNWATRRFPIIGAWPRWKPKAGKPG